MLKRLIGLAALGAVLALPASLRAQAPASVCKDGTTSNATGSGACSGHGGVDKAKTKAAHTPPAPPPAPATMVMCKDGTQSKSGQGACSHHGGVGTPTPTAAAQPPAPAPAPANPPSNMTGGPVMCADGTTSNTSGQGACSHHGGVKHNGTAPAAPPAAPPPAPANTPTMTGNGTAPSNNPQGAIAKCKDGTYSHSKQHSGACSQHGGVAQWLDGTPAKQD